MLNAKCTECDEVISSPFLAEIGTITCSHCEVDVTVKDVLVKTQSFTMHRDTLLRRAGHYQSILKEIDKEKRLQGNSKTSSTTAQKALNQYYSAIQELLEAARGNYRLPISQNLPLDIESAGSALEGELVNLSTEGAAINTYKLPELPEKGSEVKLRLTLPEIKERFSLTAKVAWARKCEKSEKQSLIKMGMSFVDLNEQVRTYIWDYIVCTHRNSYVSES